MLDRDAIPGAFERLAALLRERGVPPRAVYLLEDLFAAKARRS